MCEWDEGETIKVSISTDGSGTPTTRHKDRLSGVSGQYVKCVTTTFFSFCYFGINFDLN